MIPIVFRSIPRAARAAAVRAVPLALAALALGGCKSLDEHLPTWRSLGVFKVGMTQSQVKQLLGTPLVTSPFRRDRWDYVYEYTRQGQVIEHRNFTVHFADGKLTRWEGDAMPPSVIELNRSASAKALPSSTGEDKGFWQRLVDVFRK
jgi:outer membrane protein assembly factor BamE